jgi:Asp-tRNA(Asn)/Glu-tRNA(Gln) amidotransferase A subunit family amidase
MIGSNVSTLSLSKNDATGLADEVRSRRLTALEVTAECLRRIERLDSKLNCFTAVLAESARAQAADIDRRPESRRPRATRPRWND